MRSLRSSADSVKTSSALLVRDEADESAARVAVVGVVVRLVRELVGAERRARQSLLAPECRLRTSQGGVTNKEGAEMTWLAFAAGAPEMAALAKEQFAQSGMALIGTIRRDGSQGCSAISRGRLAGGQNGRALLLYLTALVCLVHAFPSDLSLLPTRENLYREPMHGCS